MNTTIHAPNGRGCGERSEGMPYACCGVSLFGMGIEYFVVDPAIAWPGGFQRGIKILPRKPQDPNSVNDLVIFVGEKYYPAAWDFVEEARRFGVSRKLSPTLPFEKLTPGKSRMVFVHAKAIPKFEYRLNRLPRPLYACNHYQEWVDNKAAFNGQVPEKHLNHSLCTHGLRDLAFLAHGDVEPDAQNPVCFYWVKMPSFEYQATYPHYPLVAPTGWGIGIFMALPLTHIEFCRKTHRQAEERAKKAGFETVVLEF